MKKILTVCALCLLCVCTGCMKTADSVNVKEENNVSKEVEVDTETIQQEEEQLETLTFVDAHGQSYTTTINPNVKKHEYNWDFLVNDETGISYEGDSNYIIRKGVDVSYYQGNIDWEKVKAAGYDFAFLRIGYRGYGESGTLKADENFYTNIDAAQTAGLDVGVYFFAQAIDENEAVEEAEFVLAMLEGYELQLPVVYDPEFIREDEARTDDVTGEQFTLNTIAFCEKIKEAGYEPMIYSNMVWEATLFDIEKLQEYPFWYADYEPVPQTPYEFSFWQYSETGSVDGIEGNVDLNVQFLKCENS